MSNNIYIGNRYVPVFANPVEWDNLRTYEPLTIVTYQGTSYTSKKSVPVGVALSNTDYWVVTGNYNAQVEAYRQEVADLEAEIGDLANLTTTAKNTIVAAINEVDSHCDEALALTQRHIILCGDSYVEGIGGSGTTMESAMEGLYNWDVRSFSAQGSGYIRANASNKKAIDVVNDAVAGTSDKNIITDVVLAWSVYNDMGASGSPDFNQVGFNNALEAIRAVVKANFPKARITVCPALWINVNYNQSYNTLSSWVENAGQRIGANVGHNAINWLFMAPDIDSGDHIHPNALGYIYFGQYIAQVINGSTPVFDEHFTLTAATGDSINVDIRDGFATIRGQITKTSSTPAFSTLVTLPDYFRNLSNVPCHMIKYGDMHYSATIYGLIVSNTIYMPSDQLVEDAIYILYDKFDLYARF